MSNVLRGPDHWFGHYVPPRIMKGSLVEFGTDPDTGVAFPNFDVTMMVLEVYTDDAVGGIMARVAISPDANPDYVEEQIIPIEYLELLE
mgnify:CR=1 FL=1|tara:strand:- start:1992 stop:2258 length:267 start_codon:yes stop_codon:yes gene_type:complete